MRKITRKQAVLNMQCLFDDFFKTYFRAPKEAIDETLDNTRFYEQKEKLRKAVYSTEYSSILGQLDSESFRKYYEKVGEFAKAYKIDMRLFTEETPALIEDITEVLGESPNLAEKLDLINGFTDAELKTDRISFGTKTALIESILDCWFVGDDKEQGINRMLMSLTAEDRQTFVRRIGTDRKFLNRLFQCVNGGEKDEMLAILGEIFISTGFTDGKDSISLNNDGNDRVTGSFEREKIIINITKVQAYGMRARATNRKIEASPLDIITMNYDGMIIRVPAFLLLNSWSNTFATQEGIFFNYKYEDIDWNSLDKEQKDSYFCDFVEHYLPGGFIEALGSPVQTVIMMLIGGALAIFSGGTSAAAALGTAMTAAGLAMSVADAVGALGGIVQANNLKEASRSMHEAKKAAKLMARYIAQLTVDVIDIISTVAGVVKGKKAVKNKETNRALLNKSSVSEENLIRYLESVDNNNAKRGKATNYAAEYKKKGNWPDEVQVPRKEEFLNENGSIKYLELAPDDGYVKGTKVSVKDGAELPKKGTLIDRYGTPDGRYTSPIIDGKPYAYNQRSLPFVEDMRQYHVYEVQYDSILEAINNIKSETKRNAFLDDYYDFINNDESFIFRKGQIAPAFEQIGGGIQFEFGFSIKQLINMGYIIEK